MLIKSLLSSSFPSVVRCFSSIEPNVLRSGDILRQTRVYSSEDVLEYSKVSQDSNPLHFEPEIARAAGFDDPLVHGMLVAALFPRIISSHFVSQWFRSSSLLFFVIFFLWESYIYSIWGFDYWDIHIFNCMKLCK